MNAEWRIDALCAQVDPELFFPGKGEQADARAAKSICGQCPVASDCLEWALAHESAGIWGGLTARERTKLRIASGRPTAHGAAREAQRLDVLELAAAGASVPEIAAQLGLSTRTVHRFKATPRDEAVA